MSEWNRPELDADWIRAMVAKEEELGSLPPGGASGGFGAKRGTLVHQDNEGLTTAPMNDLRAAVARADEVLGCGAMPCRFKVTSGQTTNGRCVCLDHSRAGHVLAALYKAAKAAVEPRCEVTTKSNEEVRRAWEATLGSDNVLKTCWCFD